MCPFYYDHLLRRDGLKLAGKLGNKFEQEKDSPYYKEDATKEQLQIPHVVLKNEPKKEANKTSDDSSYFPFFGGKKDAKPEIKDEKPSASDDLGLAAPGTRNITINHQFKYYNYTEINLLNHNPEYRFEKTNRTAAQENDFEERQRYIDKREKVRPGLQVDT